MQTPLVGRGIVGRMSKRSVSTDALETLGQIHTREEKRDAIHLAVEPVEAGELLWPGQEIVLEERGGKKVAVACGPAVGRGRRRGVEGLGIVDPFLTRRVFEGERFWMVLMPRMVTSLRHVWTHPAFEDTPEAPMQNRESVEYLKNFAEELGVGYDDLLENAEAYRVSGHRWTGGARFEGVHTDEEFWQHYEAVTGLRLPEERGENFISCSC